MADSGFDTLTNFKIDINLDPLTPVNAIKPVQSGGQFKVTEQPSYTPTVEDEINKEISTTQAEVDVNSTSYMNMMANEFAGQYLPIKQQRQDYAQQYYKALGLGTRYNPADFEAEIKQALGPLPEKSGLDTTLNFIIDALNGRTNFKGVAGAVDILAQATGKAIGRAEQDSLNKIAYQMKVGELAVQQAQDANKIIMEKEADFFLKMMGYDNDDMTTFLNFNKDILKDVSQHNLDVQKERIKSSLDMLNNLEKPLSISYEDANGVRQVGSVRQVPSEYGPQLMLGRNVELEDGRTVQIFDIPLPATKDGSLNFNILGTVQPGTEASIFQNMVPTAVKVSEGVSDFASLDNIRYDITNILTAASEDINKIGLPGNIQSVLQTVGFNIESILNELSKNSGGTGFAGSNLYNSGEMMFNKDFLKFDDYNQKETTITLTDIPSKFNKFATNSKDVEVSMADLFNEDWFKSQGYDPSYAENKVRENFIIYGLARANKPSGRLNVDDIKRASDAISIYGAKAPQDVIAALKEVDRKIKQAQAGLLRTYPEIIIKDPTFSDRSKAEKKLIELGLDPADFDRYFQNILTTGTSPDASSMQNEKSFIYNQPTQPDPNFDNEGESFEIDDIFGSTLDGMENI